MGKTTALIKQRYRALIFKRHNDTKLCHLGALLSGPDRVGDAEGDYPLPGPHPVLCQKIPARSAGGGAISLYYSQKTENFLGFYLPAIFNVNILRQ